MGRVCVVLLALALSGCGIAKRMEALEQAKQLAAQSDAALAECNAKFPAPNPKTVVARVKCLNDAMAIRMPLFGTDQDLALAYMADRMMVAEKIENGKMTMVEGNAAVAEKWSPAKSGHRPDILLSAGYSLDQIGSGVLSPLKFARQHLGISVI
jgi:hypothetical protein